jgi:hypothetical protein
MMIRSTAPKAGPSYALELDELRENHRIELHIVSRACKRRDPRIAFQGIGATDSSTGLIMSLIALDIIPLFPQARHVLYALEATLSQ